MRRRHPARHRVGAARQRTSRTLAPMIAQAAADGARLVVLTEMFSTGFSMKTDRIAEPDDGPSAQFLVEQARAHDVWVCGVDPRARAPSATGPYNQLVLAGARRHAAPLRQDPPVHATAREHEHYAAGDAFLTVDDRRPARQLLRLLRPALRRRVLGARATTTDCYVVVANWPAVAPQALAGAADARARSRTRPTSSASTASATGGKLALRGRLDDHRSVRRDAGAQAARTETIISADVDPDDGARRSAPSSRSSRTAADAAGTRAERCGFVTCRRP